MSTFHELTIAETRIEPNDTLWVRFEVPQHLTEQFAFRHGQYLTLRDEIDGVEVRRSYSICAAAGDPLAVAIKRIEGGAFSERAHERFAPGVPVAVMAPAGDFTSEIRPELGRRYLCIAAGSGITPVMSIIETVLRDEPLSEVTLLYGNRRTADIIFRERLSWLKNAHLARFQWVNILSQEPQPSELLQGRINNRKGAELNEQLLNIAGFDQFFLCGPEGMISEVSRGLRGLGIDEERIHYELFFASAEDAREAMERHAARAAQYAGMTTEVRVRAGGREVAFDLTADGENILDGAMDAGLSLPFSCKGGVCATCKARVLEGQVDMDLNHALSAAEVEQGFVLTCQAHPISDRVVVDFDVV